MRKSIISPIQRTTRQDIVQFHGISHLVRELTDLKEEHKRKIEEATILAETAKRHLETSNLHLEVANEHLNRAKDIQKGDKGDKGDIPVAGVHYVVPQNGYTPRKGVDYFDAPAPDHEHIINEVTKRIPVPQKGKDYFDGKDAVVDHNLIINEVAKKVKVPTPKIDEKKLGKLVQDKIEEHLASMPKPDVHIDEVKGFKEALAPMNANISRYLLSGTGDTVTAGTGISITEDSEGSKVINASAGTVYTETPSGAVNSINTSYTVLHTITTVIGFWINGQFLHPTSDYTFSGTTITMVSALPTELSATGFTISYV